LLAAGEVQFVESLDAAGEWEARKALLRATGPASSPYSWFSKPAKAALTELAE
jgi:hypothetical protein